MYKIENLNLRGEFATNILNKGKNILLTKSINDRYEIQLYEKSNKSNKSSYKLVNKIFHDDIWGILYLTMLSNEMILTSSRHTIIIYKKKKDSSYKKYQRITNISWAEIYQIKELENENFAVCGWYGFMIFNKYNSKYKISLEINESIIGENSMIYDFMKIKGKENSFILYGYYKAFIINERTIINQITLEKELKNFLCFNNLICQFNDELFILSGWKYFTLFNANQNIFKKISFLGEIKEKVEVPLVYKYNSNSIIVCSSKGIFIVQLFNNEKIQVNTFIKFDKLGHRLNYIKEEKALYYKESLGNEYIMKLNFKK